MWNEEKSFLTKNGGKTVKRPLSILKNKQYLDKLFPGKKSRGIKMLTSGLEGISKDCECLAYWGSINFIV